MNIHLPAILGFTRYQGFDPSPYNELCIINLIERITPSVWEIGLQNRGHKMIKHDKTSFKKWCLGFDKVSREDNDKT